MDCQGSVNADFSTVRAVCATQPERTWPGRTTSGRARNSYGAWAPDGRRPDWRADDRLIWGGVVSTTDCCPRPRAILAAPACSAGLQVGSQRNPTGRAPDCCRVAIARSVVGTAPAAWPRSARKVADRLPHTTHRISKPLPGNGSAALARGAPHHSVARAHQLWTSLIGLGRSAQQ